MRQVIIKKKPPKPQQKKEEDLKATSLATKSKKGKDEGGATYYCCGKSGCRHHHCPKKDLTPIKEWVKPDMTPLYLLKKEKAKRDAAQAANAQTTSPAEYDSDDKSLVEFWGMHILKKCHARTSHEEILDSGSMITVSKDEEGFRNLKPCKRNIIMATNVGSEKLIANESGKNGERCTLFQMQLQISYL